MSDPTVASVFLKLLKKHGIRHVFGLPTIQIAMMQDGFGRDPAFKFISVRHEEATGHMAHGVAKTSEDVALCFATVGTGVANMLPGIAAASRDHVPMIALTSNNHLRLIEPAIDYLQTVDQMSLFKPITKWGAGLRDASCVVDVVERSIYRAKSGCPGPVQIDVPFDLHTETCRAEIDETSVLEPPRPIPSTQEIATIVDMLTKAKRPLIVAGGGVARSRAVDAFRALVQRTGFAAMTTMNGNGALAPDSPTDIGHCGVFGGYGVFKACEEADLILSIGCRFGIFVPVNKPTRPSVPGQKIIQIDIDPDQISAVANTSFGVVGDARETLLELNKSLEGQSFHADPVWLENIRAERQRFWDEITGLADQETIEGKSILNEAAIARAVIQSLPKDVILSVDGGQCWQWSATWFKPKDPYHFVSNPGMGHLGFGLPAALGAKLANPDKTVVTMLGDGAFGMTIQELETAVRYNISIVVIVYDDSKWGMYERPNRGIFKNDNFGTSMSKSNYAQIAEGFGCHGVVVDTIDELKAAVNDACARDQVTVIQVPTEYTPHPTDELWRPMNTANADFRPVELTA